MAYLKNNSFLPNSILLGKSIISLVGAGGKTSTAFWLAKHLKSFGLNILVSTTTKMFKPKSTQYDYIYNLDNVDELIWQSAKNISIPSIHYCASSYDTQTNKVSGFNCSDIDYIKKKSLFDVLIIEADGAHAKALKAPAEYEPCVPEQSDLVIAVSGAEAILVPANPNDIQRWELFSAITNCIENQIIDCSVMNRLIQHPFGLFKGTPEKAIKIWLINKIELFNSDASLVAFSSDILLANKSLHSILLANMQNEQAIKYQLHSPYS